MVGCESVRLQPVVVESDPVLAGVGLDGVVPAVGGVSVSRDVVVGVLVQDLDGAAALVAVVDVRSVGQHSVDVGVLGHGFGVVAVCSECGSSMLEVIYTITGSAGSTNSPPSPPWGNSGVVGLGNSQVGYSQYAFGVIQISPPISP